MNHTPTPWTLDHGSIGAKVDGHSVQIALMSTTQWMGQLTEEDIRIRDIFESQKESNASLLLSAPKLLEACKTMLARMKHTNIHTRIKDMDTSVLEDAIAEAEGFSKESTVGALDTSDYTFVQNEDDVNSVRELIGSDENFRYFIVKAKDGDYEEVWGCDSPALDATALRIK